MRSRRSARRTIPNPPWPRIWSTKADLYMPLFHFARMHRVPMLALNVERTVTRRIAAEGLTSLSADEREGVGDPAPPSSHRC